ncbi:glycosyltransferase [Paenalcaligenes hominis]
MPSILDEIGRSLFYRYTPALDEKNSPLLVILHGHTHNALPSRYKNDHINVLAPVDNFGLNNSGSWWLGEKGDFFVKKLLHKLIINKISRTNGDLYFWGSSMGGYGAILHGTILNAKAVYANIPQIRLLGSTYSNMGMEPFFKKVFGNSDSEYNDLALFLERKFKEGGIVSPPLFFIAQSRYDYKNYLEEQSLYFFQKCLTLGLNISYEVFPKKGHELMLPAHEAINKMFSYNFSLELKKNEMKMRSVVFGIMNFSVLYSMTNAFKVSRKDYKEYKESILKPERIRMRERVFFDYTVPSILKQHSSYKEEGVLLVLNVAISDQLPQCLIDRFDGLVKDYPQIFNVIKVPEDKNHVWIDIFNEELVKIKNKYSFEDVEIPFLNFRIDDDDLLSPGYFKAIKNYLSLSYEGFYLTFPNGFVGVYDDGFKSFYEINKPYLAIGLSKICKFDINKEEIITEDPVVSSRAHTVIVKNSKTILDSTFSAYIWTMHKFSDTRSNDSSDRTSFYKIQRFIDDNQLESIGFKDVEEVFEKSFSSLSTDLQ